MMKVTRTSALSGTTRAMVLDVTPEQMAEYEAIPRTRTLQEIFPDLSPDDREFIKSGITPEEWDATFLFDEEEYTQEDYDLEQSFEAYQEQREESDW